MELNINETIPYSGANAYYGKTEIEPLSSG